jgi:hypothetical protein
MKSICLTSICRETYPLLLQKGNRGKFHNIKSVPAKFGEVKASSGVAGIELLDAFEKGEIVLDENGDVNLLTVVVCY